MRLPFARKKKIRLCRLIKVVNMNGSEYLKVTNVTTITEQQIIGKQEFIELERLIISPSGESIQNGIDLWITL